MDLSTVGGWLACRGAGQYSTRYGKIEDMVIGLEVVLADGRIVHTEGHGPRAATGPNLTQLFVGSEGTLGVITEARLRIHPLPPAQERRAFGFTTFAAGLEACRRILRRGATPAVLRLYDADRVRPQLRAARHQRAHRARRDRPGAPGRAPSPSSTTSAARPRRAAAGPRPGGALARPPQRRLGPGPAVARRHRRRHGGDLGAVGRAARRSSTRWSARSARIDGTLAASAHQSHAYTDGACLYFTFAGRGPERRRPAWRERYYRQAWDTVTDATMAHGAAISHHHGIGLNRSRFLPAPSARASTSSPGSRQTFDPAGILNPGKLGLPSPFGPPPGA